MNELTDSIHDLQVTNSDWVTLSAADEVIPAGTRTRKVKAQAQPKVPKPSPKKKKVVSARPVTKGRPRKEPEEYEVCYVCIILLYFVYQGKCYLWDVKNQFENFSIRISLRKYFFIKILRENIFVFYEFGENVTCEILGISVWGFIFVYGCLNKSGADLPCLKCHPAIFESSKPLCSSDIALWLPERGMILQIYRWSKISLQ